MLRYGVVRRVNPKALRKYNGLGVDPESFDDDFPSPNHLIPLAMKVKGLVR